MKVCQRHFLIFLAAILLWGCAREIPIQQTITRNGRLYEKGTDTPFTGIVSGKTARGYRPHGCTYKMAYKDGILNGESRFWYPNGKLESVEPYRDGKINGIVTRYNTNGRVRARIHLVDGQRGGKHGEIFWSLRDGPRNREALF